LSPSGGQTLAGEAIICIFKYSTDEHLKATDRDWLVFAYTDLQPGEKDIGDLDRLMKCLVQE